MLSHVQILNRQDYRVNAVFSGEQVVASTAEFRPDVLLSGVVMPGMNCIEAATAILRICPQRHVILFSGQAITADLLARHRARYR